MAARLTCCPAVAGAGLPTAAAANPKPSPRPPRLLAEGAALGEESSAALQLLARQGEELRAAQRELREAQQRCAALDNDNVQLQARVSGGWAAILWGVWSGVELGARPRPVYSLSGWPLARACKWLLLQRSPLAHPAPHAQRWSGPTRRRPLPC